MGSAEGFGFHFEIQRKTTEDHPCTSKVHKEKAQMVKQKSSSSSRRGDKRNSKVHKNRIDSFSMKNGLVGFSSTSGGNNFFGLYGLKPEVFDITKYGNEPSLDELLHGSYDCHVIAKGKEKKAANSNQSLLQSVGKACSVLKPQRDLIQESPEIDGTCIQMISAGSGNTSPVAVQTDCDKGDSCSASLPPPSKVQESGDKIKPYSVADSPLYQPKDILARLALPPPKDLDMLILDASKTSLSSKNSADPRLGKTNPHRIGLPPFPWSHSFSGHNKFGADAVKLSTSRTICNGRWVKVKDSAILQKGSADFLVDFESLTFDKKLVPEVKLTPGPPGKGIAPTELVLSSTRACSTIKVPAGEPSPTYAAAQTLCDMATKSSKENPNASVKLPKNSPQMSMKACLKSIKKSDKLLDSSNKKPHNAVAIGDNGFPSKKQRLSTDVRNVYNGHSDSVTKAPLHGIASQSFRPPPMKLFRDPNGGKDSYSINVVKKSYLMKPPRGIDRPSSSRQKLRTVVPMKLSRPES